MAMAVPTIVCGLLIAILVYTDIRSLKVPNVVTVPAAVTAVSIHTVLSSWAGLWLAVSGLVVVFAIAYTAYVCRMIGGGDVKACAALGGFMGFQDGLLILTYALLAAAFVSVIVLLFKGTAAIWAKAIMCNLVCFVVYRQWRHLALTAEAPVHVIPLMPAVAFGFVYVLYIQLCGGGA